jgi:hypothetical protein
MVGFLKEIDMKTNSKSGAWLWFVGFVVLVLMEALSLPAAAQSGGDGAKTLKEKTAQAEKQVAVKRVALKVAEAQMAIAQARLQALKVDVTAAKAAEEYTKAKLQRMKELFAKKAVPEELVHEAELNHQAKVAARQKAEATVKIGEAEVTLQAVQVELAQAELAVVELLLKQLQDHLKAGT